MLLLSIWVLVLTQLHHVQRYSGVSAGGSIDNCLAWEINTDYYSRTNLATHHGKKTWECCYLCQGNSRCLGWSWSSYRGGTCWLKSTLRGRTWKNGVTSGRVKNRGKCSWHVSRDIDTTNLKVFHGKRSSSCCELCQRTFKCLGWSWNNYKGGTCWLKRTTGPLKYKRGVTSGVLV